MKVDKDEGFLFLRFGGHELVISGVGEFEDYIRSMIEDPR